MQFGETITIREVLTAAAVFTLTSATYVVYDAAEASVASGTATVTNPGTASQTLSFNFTPSGAGIFHAVFTYVVGGETIYAPPQRILVGVNPSPFEELVVRLRGIIHDPPGTEQVFTDDELQEMLERFRQDIWQEELLKQPTWSGGVGPTYLTYRSGWTDWGANVVLQNSSYATLTPSAADHARGSWRFATEPAYPVYATGQAYDLFGAAAEALYQWAGKLALAYDFESNTQRYTRSQQAAMLLTQARALRARQSASV